MDNKIYVIYVAALKICSMTEGFMDFKLVSYKINMKIGNLCSLNIYFFISCSQCKCSNP